MNEPVDLDKLTRAIDRNLCHRVEGVPPPSRIPRRILVIDDQADSAVALADALAGGDDDVVLAADGPDAMARLRRGLDGALAVVVAPADPLAFIRSVRDQTDLGFVHVVFASVAVRPTDVARAFEAGVDDFVRKPWRRPEVVDRLCRRLAAIARAAQLHRQAILAGHLYDATGLTPETMEALETASFLDAADVIEQMLRDFIGQPIEVRQARPGRPALGAFVKLVDVHREVELGAAVAAGGDDCRRLCAAFFGPGSGDPELYPDVLGELSNMVMACLKSAFVADDFAFASGVPVVCSPEQMAREAARFATRKMLVARGNGFGFSILLGLRARPRRGCAVSDLAEGMILAQDLRTDDGALLARAGTRVTRGIVARIAAETSCDEVKVSDPRLQPT